MTHFTEVNGVYFTESSLAMNVLGRIEVRAATQNTTLTQVKEELAFKAKALGGNGVINFKYGQKADTPLKNIFSFKWDTERMTATGDVVTFEADPRG